MSWVEEASFNLDKSKNITGTRALGWDTVRGAALSYCQQKKDQHRFDDGGKFDTS